MKAALILLVSLFTAQAFAADPPLCLTISAPNKWAAGIVLRIAKETDGTTSAQLIGQQMFRGRIASNDFLNFQVIGNVNTAQNADGTVSYTAGEEAYDSLNVRIGKPYDNGRVEGLIVLKFGDMTITSKSANLTKHQDGTPCN